jgi:hypothetical protein
MATYQINLTQADIREIIAKHLGVDLADVTITVSRGYDGPPTDSEAPNVTATVSTAGRIHAH